MPPLLIFIIFVVIAILIGCLNQKLVNRIFRKSESKKRQTDLASEDVLLNNIWRFQARATVDDLWQQLQRFVITGEAEKGKLYVVSAHENKIVWAVRLKGTTIGFTSQMDIEKADAEITAMFSFIEWSFSSGELPFLNEMRILFQSIKTAFQSADNNFTVTQIRKVS